MSAAGPGRAGRDAGPAAVRRASWTRALADVAALATVSKAVSTMFGGAAARGRSGPAVQAAGGPAGALEGSRPMAMSVTAAPFLATPPSRGGDPNRLGHGRDGRERQPTAEHGERGPASKRVIVGYGFWIFLLSDVVMFSAFFAAYAVLADSTAGGPSGRDLFDLGRVGIETACLLLSSFTCGLAAIGAQARRASWFHAAMAATFALGAAFLAIEVAEFAGMAARGTGPTRSAFLSAFFTLVGCHGLHVTVGLLWLLTMMAQVFAKGFRADILRRVLCFNLFWHALDIVWVALFTVVYLMGVGR